MPHPFHSLIYLIFACLTAASLPARTAGRAEEGQQQPGPVIFRSFPQDPSMVQDDLRPHVAAIIKQHGPEEWRICVMTNEIHQHLGIYSIVGAKMGLWAREIFGAELDEVRVTSYAGSRPPVSCLNDGLQVSTGATLGHGTITVAGDSPVRPEAQFTRGGRTIGMRLKAEVLKRIRADIEAGIKKHGDLTPAYFHFIRELALRYWSELDRSQIFEIVEAP